jgi:hypothetical protein
LQVDYEKNNGWERLERTNLTDWNTNLETIVEWSPYPSETDLLNQVYNLWHFLFEGGGGATTIPFFHWKEEIYKNENEKEISEFTNAS